MSENKKLFSSLKTLSVAAFAGTALALAPVKAFAGHEGDHGCSGKKGEKADCSKCSAEKKAECEKEHGGEHSCSGHEKK